jgi:integrase
LATRNITASAAAALSRFANLFSTEPSAPRISIGILHAAVEHDYAVNGKKTLRHLRLRWKNHLGVFRDELADQVTVQQINNYVSKRLEEKAANGTINRELSDLKRCFKLAEQTGVLKRGTMPHIAMLKEAKPRKGFVKDAQYAALARATSRIGLWLRALFEIGFTYGWRKNELVTLRVSQVDLSERTITLNPGETKNDEGRIVEMTEIVYDMLQILVAGKSTEDFVFTGPRKYSLGTVFRYRQSRYWWIQYYVQTKICRESSRSESKDEACALLQRRLQALPASNRPIHSFKKAWAAATKAAGVPELLFHDLRRTAVRNLVRAGVTEKVAMTITGHKTRSVFERYNIVDQDDLHRAVGLMNQASFDRGYEPLPTGESQMSFCFEGPVPDPQRKPVAGDRQLNMQTVRMSAKR